MDRWIELTTLRKIRKENRTQQKASELEYIELYKKRSDNRKPKKNYSAIGNGIMSFSEALEFDLDKKYSIEDLFNAAKKTMQDFAENSGTRIIKNSLVFHKKYTLGLSNDQVISCS